jgi:C_GCAxxG_C_C family probable redox protein
MNHLTEIQERAAEKAAAEFFEGKYHCAEAVASNVVRIFGCDPNGVLAQATPFGGGVGRTHCEACGALMGGLIAIGSLYGRKEPGMNWDIPARLAADLRHEFIMDFGTTHCETLRERFGTESQMEECREIVKKTAETLMGLLNEDP